MIWWRGQITMPSFPKYSVKLNSKQKLYPECVDTAALMRSNVIERRKQSRKTVPGYIICFCHVQFKNPLFIVAEQYINKTLIYITTYYCTYFFVFCLGPHQTTVFIGLRKRSDLWHLPILEFSWLRMRTSSPIIWRKFVGIREGKITPGACCSHLEGWVRLFSPHFSN